MPSITLKNIPPEIHALLKQSAEANRRSINREAIACIERAMCNQPVDPELLLVNACSAGKNCSLYSPYARGVCELT